MEKRPIELKQCPYCGNRKVNLRQWRGYWYVECGRSYCYPRLYFYHTKEEAIREWNREWYKRAGYRKKEIERMLNDGAPD